MARQTQILAELNNITGWQELSPNPKSKNGSGDANTEPGVSAETSQGNPNPIIKCIDADHGEFFTNAASCDEADLANRMSYAEPYDKDKPENTYGGKGYTPPEQQAVNSRSDRKQKSDQE